MQLTQIQIDHVRTSFRQVAALRDEAGVLFYQRLFETAPGVRGMFPEDISAQAGKLTAALGLVVANVSNWQTLGPVVEELARRHVDYGVEPAHYDVVGNVLLGVLAEALGESFTDEVREAWTAAYTGIAARMIEAAYGREAA